jgi:glutaredoxin
LHPRQRDRAPEIQVVLLSQPDCVQCDHAKEVLSAGRSGFARKISELDVGSGEERCARDGGVLFAPGVFVEGRLFSYGRLSERLFRRMLSTADRLA